jgi:pimeloyl-ACP methyl ester carboxylesterase
VTRSLRSVEVIRPARTGVQNGLAYALWLPPAPPVGGVVVVHGAGSVKESHYDFARAALALGFAVLTFDQRGHGESEGRFDGHAVSDVVAMAGMLRASLAQDAAGCLALRGSSLGGYLALRAAGPAQARAVVAICPATADGLTRALERPELDWRTDPESVTDLLAEQRLGDVVAELTVPVLLLHAQGDEQVPLEHSRELAASLKAPGSRLIEVPGGHHRSIQHDEELQAVSLRFLQGALGLR